MIASSNLAGAAKLNLNKIKNLIFEKSELPLFIVLNWLELKRGNSFIGLIVKRWVKKSDLYDYTKLEMQNFFIGSLVKRLNT